MAVFGRRAPRGRVAEAQGVASTAGITESAKTTNSREQLCRRLEVADASSGVMLGDNHFQPARFQL
jgi:hypothetical protein